MNRIERAIEMMQRSSEAPLAVQDIAASIGLTPVAFSRLFTAAQGIGPLAYMRRARLERAAEQIVSEPDRPLVEVALDAGFESQQTFTRAFTAAFGMPPGEFRKTGPARRTTMHDDIAVEPKFSEHSIVSMPSRRFAGRKVTIDGTADVTPASAWAALELPVSGQVEGMSYGVCFSETAGAMTTYLACVELKVGAQVPPGLDELTLPQERYFVIKQHMPAKGFGDHLRAGLERLWSRIMPEAGVTPSGRPDLEGYPDDLIAGQTEGWLTYMVPINQ